VPETVRPAFSLAEFPSLARYGFWISLTRILSAMTGGLDDLVITAACGAAALPPWSICKKLLLTVHTFLAQHVEHLIPTLGSVREKSRQTFESINAGMHWYVVVVGAAGYTFVAWAGPAIVAAAAGEKVAALCEIPLSAFSVCGFALALNIIPVISAMALTDAKPGFLVSLFNNISMLSALVLLVRTMGVPAAYYAPLFAVPFLVAAVGASSSRLLDPGLARRRLQPVLVPVACGLAGVAASLVVPVTLTLMQRAVVGVCLAPVMIALVILIEHLLGINGQAHRQLLRVIRHALEIVFGLPRAFLGRLSPGSLGDSLPADRHKTI
jgi:hypothetical protein